MMQWLSVSEMAVDPLEEALKASSYYSSQIGIIDLSRPKPASPHKGDALTEVRMIEECIRNFTR